MQVLVGILADRLKAIGPADDRERLRAHLALCRAGEVDPPRDRRAIVIVGLGGGSGPRLRPPVANDGEGLGEPDGDGLQGPAR